MKEFKTKPLKGLEDLGDKKYSLKSLGAIAGGKNSGDKNVISGHLDRIRTKEGCIKGGVNGGKKAGKIGGPKGGKVQGRRNVESGFLLSICSSGGKVGGVAATNISYTCEHCGKKGNGPSMLRWHLDNCKHKP